VLKEADAANFVAYMAFMEDKYDAVKNTLAPIVLDPAIPVPTIPAGCSQAVKDAAASLQSFVNDLEAALQYEMWLQARLEDCCTN
jgi:hypothetical protein